MDYLEMMDRLDSLKDSAAELAWVARQLEREDAWTAPDTGETVVFRVEGARALGLGALSPKEAALAARVVRATLKILGLQEE